MTTLPAHRWHKNGDHPEDYAAGVAGYEAGKLRTFSGAERRARGWEGGVVRYFRNPGIRGDQPCGHCGARMHDHGWIDEGSYGKTVCPGDFIVTAPDGSYHPLRPQTYDALRSRRGPA